MAKTNNEIELWDQLRAGNKSALEKIYRDHTPVLLKYGSRFTSNSQTVEDCIQDLFVEIWRNRQGIGQTDSIKRYLLASLRRKILRHLDKQKRLVYSEDSEPHSFDLEIAIDEKMVQKEIKQEYSEQLQAAFNHLSKRQKEAIYLKYYAGLEYEDICEVMDINYQSIRNLVSNALKKMKRNVSTSLIIFVLDNFLHFF